MSDYQRRRVYDSENAALIPLQTRVEGIDAIQEWVNRITRQPWFIERWGSKRIPVVKGRENTSAHSDGWSISLPSWAWSDRVILHEMAHTITHDTHGPEFAAAFRYLVKRVMGDDAARALGNAYYDRRVDVARLPDAQRERVAAARQAKARVAAKSRHERQRGATTGERQTAADAIRREVRRGTFGPAGSKPRRHALDTARTLEASR